MENANSQLLIQEFLKIIRGLETRVSLSKKLNHSYNIYKRWEEGHKKFLWQDFVKIGTLKEWNLTDAIEKCFKIEIKSDFSDQNIIQSLLSTLSNTDSIYKEFSKQKIFRILRNNRKFTFEEFLLLSELITGSSFAFLSYFLDNKEQKVLEKIKIDSEYNKLVGSDVLTLIIRNFLEIQEYERLDGHSDDTIAKSLKVSNYEVLLRLRALETLDIIEKDKEGIYKIKDTRNDHITFGRDYSNNIHNFWRKEINRRAVLNEAPETIKGAHLLYKSSIKIDSKVVELANRFFNDLRLLIKEENEKSKGELTKLKVMSLNFMDFFESKQD